MNEAAACAVTAHAKDAASWLVHLAVRKALEQRGRGEPGRAPYPRELYCALSWLLG